MCYDPWREPDEDINGECPECGTVTMDGEAAEGCGYSPIACTTCQWRPCDGSC